MNGNWSKWNQWLLWLGLAAAVVWLVVNHRAHLWEVAPFLIILACPLMHLFGHGGHGGHGDHAGRGEPRQDRPPDAAPPRDESPPRHSH